MSKIQDRVFKVLAEQLPRLETDTNLELHEPLATYGLNSMRAVELLFALEDEFEIEISDEEIGNGTFKDLESVKKMISIYLEES